MNESNKAVPAVKIGGHKFKNDLIFIAVLLLLVIAIGMGPTV